MASRTAEQSSGWIDGEEAFVAGDERAGLVAEEPEHLVRPSEHAGPDVPFPASDVRDALRLREQRLAGDVEQEHGELAARRAEDGDLEVLAEVVGLEARGRAALRHLRAGLEPGGRHVRHDLEDAAADDLLAREAGEPLEGRVHVEQAVVARPAGLGRQSSRGARTPR